MDELGTITKLFDQQKMAIRTMLKYYDYNGNGKGFLNAALKRIDDHFLQLSEMKSTSISAQKAVENLLDLKQKQANVDEARMARWQAEATQEQSRSVMVFTVFSVMSVGHFLPFFFFFFFFFNPR